MSVSRRRRRSVSNAARADEQGGGRSRRGGRGNAERQEQLRRRAGKPSRVANADELHKALRRAEAGDWIQLEDGLYQGQFSMRNVKGTKAAPVRIEGSSKAVVEGFTGKPGKPARSGRDIAKTTLTLNQVDHAELTGFTILGGQRGLILNGCDHNTMDGLTVKDTLAEAVHFKESSSYNTIQNSHIKDAGMGFAAPWLPETAAKGEPSEEKMRGNGEGVYIGTDSKKWGKDGVRPDHSNHNKVLGNYIEGTSAEHIDVKDGVRGTLIQGNHFVADDRFSGDNGAESMVDIKGNDNTVRDNAFVNRSGERVKGWHVTRRDNKDRRSGRDNTFEGNRFTGTTSKDLFDNQGGDDRSLEKTNTVRDDLSDKAEDLSVKEWRAGRGGSPSRPSTSGGGGGGGGSTSSGGGGDGGGSAQREDAEWRQLKGRWDPTRTRRATRLFEAPGRPGRKLSQGEALWVRSDSEDETKLSGGEERPSWRVMVDEGGEGSDEKGRVAAEALPSRFQPSSGQSSSAGTQSDGGLDGVSAPSGAGAKDKEFPEGIAQMLLKETGLDSTQWDNIADLIAKPEQDQERGWNRDPGKFYGFCKDLDTDDRGYTLTAFGATTGEGVDDAQRLFKEFGTSAKELGLGKGDGEQFQRNIRALGNNPKWQQAVWRWFHKEYVAKSVAELRERGFTSALTIAAVTDCSLNQGFFGKHGSEKLMGRIGRVSSEAEFLERFLDERDKHVDDKKMMYNAYGNGARRVAMYRKLLKRGQLDLRDKGAVRDAVDWKMHGPNDA